MSLLDLMNRPKDPHSGPLPTRSPRAVLAPRDQHLALSYALRQKPDWVRKLADQETRAKWGAEALATTNDQAEFPSYTNDGDNSWSDYEPMQIERPRLTEKMVDYVLDELTLHAQQLDDPSGIRASCFGGVYESDSLVPANLLAQLKEHVATLEANPPFGTPDWHPGSDEQVLDLVHPSLFPLRYGITPIRETAEDGSTTTTVAAPPKPYYQQHSTSEEFQWLPADFDVDAEGKTTIASYINNLHPIDHAAFYPVLASVFDRFLPMFERVLSDLRVPPPRRIPVDREVAGSYYSEPPEDMSDNEMEEWEKNKVVALPEPAPFVLPSAEEVKKRMETPAIPLKGRKLQVIVKLASIHLSPDKPDYPGGVWHVEGMSNEEIVASGIYYFDQDNIGESRLAFRGSFDDERLPYDQDDILGVKTVFGIDRDGPCTQYYASASTCAGRALAWPNIYQHRVSPFSLADRSKPGHRKILVFFLVDPLKSVVSTARVPYQQRAWAERELPRDKMPLELWHTVLDGIEGLMTFDEAKKVREVLMKERKFLVDENTQRVFERRFSLCEH